MKSNGMSPEFVFDMHQDRFNALECRVLQCTEAIYDGFSETHFSIEGRLDRIERSLAKLVPRPPRKDWRDTVKK